jgi:hypothetical protein
MFQCIVRLDKITTTFTFGISVTTPKLEHFEMHINNSLGASVIEIFDNDSDLRR